MEQTISGKINVKHLVQTTAHAIVKHQPKTENANGLIIVAIASTNMLEAKKVKKAKLTKHKISLYEVIVYDKILLHLTYIFTNSSTDLPLEPTTETTTEMPSSTDSGRLVYIISFSMKYFNTFLSLTLFKFVDFFVSDYTKLSENNCYDDRYGSYYTIQEAMTDCSSDGNCQGVYDAGCDAQGGDIYLCSTSATFVNGSTSCVYQKYETGKCFKSYFFPCPTSNYNSAIY